METIFLFISGAVLLIAIVIVIVDRIGMRKITDNINRMLDDAIKGDFKETTFSEDVDSLIESKIAEYLATSSTSAKKVEEEKEKIKSLISDISHQTKTPIANLMLYSELLSEEELTPSASEKVAAIKAQSDKLKFLIDSLVKMSRLENGIFTFDTESLLVSDMLENIVDDLVPKAESKGLKLTCIDTDLTVKCDPKWTYEAVSNITDNAIKYTEKGSVTLSATAYEMFIKIDISDTGIGISEEESAKIFGRFYRVQGNGAKEGVGIGLYLAREIITGQGGYIKLSSEPGKGSTFSIFLPRA